jgi:hypothetical protein
VPLGGDELVAWWLQAGKAVTKPRHRAFDSLFLLVARSIWLEWNVRVFRGQLRLPSVLLTSIVELCELWCRARVVDRSELHGE